MDLGDRAEDSIIDFLFSTGDATGPVTLTGTPSLAIYKDSGTTESTAGITLDVDFDSIVGLNHVTIDLSSNVFYAPGSDFDVIIAAGTVGAVSQVGQVIASFSIEKRTAAARLRNVADHGGAAAIISLQRLVVANSTSDPAFSVTNSDGPGAQFDSTSTNGDEGLRLLGGSFGDALLLRGGLGDGTENTSGYGLNIRQGQNSWGGRAISVTSYDSPCVQLRAVATAFNIGGHALVLTADGPGKHGVFSTGGSKGFGGLFQGGAAATGIVVDATNASPIKVTSVAHGLVTGDKVTITGATGNTAANVTDNAITAVDADNFTLDGTTGNGAYDASSGTWVTTSPTHGICGIGSVNGDGLHCVGQGTGVGFNSIPDATGFGLPVGDYPANFSALAIGVSTGEVSISEGNRLTNVKLASDGVDGITIEDINMRQALAIVYDLVARGVITLAGTATPTVKVGGNDRVVFAGCDADGNRSGAAITPPA